MHIGVRDFRNTVICCLSCEVTPEPQVCVCVIVVAGQRAGELGCNFGQTHSSLTTTFKGHLPSVLGAVI